MRLRTAVPALFLIGILTVHTHSKAEIFKPGQYEKSLIHAGMRRTYILRIPPEYDSQKAFPMVLLFHGGGGNARQALNNYGLAEKADKEGFILVAPYGSGLLRERLLTWNVGFGFGYAMNHQVDDIGFVRRLIDELEKDLKIDPKRIFATGISNGGILCHFLAAALSDRIAAIAPVVAAIGGKKSIAEPYILPAQPAEAVSVIAFNGILDKHIPYSGGLQEKSIGDPVWVKSAQETQAFWVKADRCDSTPIIEESKENEYKRITYAQCVHDSEVIQYLIYNQGHAWPGGEKPRWGADAPAQKISATDLMWEFFKKHPGK